MSPAFNNRVSPNQLNNFIGNPAARGAFDNNNIPRVNANQVNVNLNNHLNSFQNGVFTSDWYAKNPNAWQWQHPHADAYAAATWNNAAAWVGIAAAPVPYAYAQPAVVYQDNSTTYDNTQQAQTTSTLASTADNYSATDSTEWLPLGVFSLVPGNQENPTAMVQMQVSKEGILNGTYLDLLSHNGTPLQGAIDKKTQLAAWKVNQNDNVTFETNLSSLTSDTAPLTVRYSNQQPQQWQLVRSKQQ